MTAEFHFFVKQSMFRHLLPAPRYRLPEWADQYRVLSRVNAARPGGWRTATVQVARGPMMAVDEPGVETITLMVATQMMKTSVIENTIARAIHQDPCPIMIVQPKDESAEAFSKERLQPMIEATPVLTERVAPQGGRRGSNTIQYKGFPNGFVVCVGAGSPTNLAMRPIRIVCLDEIDKYQPTKEGDPILLAEERTSTFPNRLSIRACSPTVEEASRIYSSYGLSDQRRPYLECPYCGHWQYIEFFRSVHWEKRGGQHRPETAHIFCEACNSPWTEEQRLVQLQSVRWMQTRTFECCGEGQDPRQTRNWDYDEENEIGYAVCQTCGNRGVPNRHAGFTASKLYSPFISVAELAEKWLASKDDPESRQTFYNTQLALPYKIEASKEISAGALNSRSEVWNAVPDKVCVITAGVDVHPGSNSDIGRLEIEIVGWNEFEESWSLAYETISGDPAKQEIWQELDKLLLAPLTREDGRQMKILGTCIDTGGHNTQEAYRFAAPRFARNIWGIKGASDRGGQWSPVWPSHDRRRNRNFRGSYRPVIIGVNAAKEAIRQRLLIQTPGPGYCHFPAGRPPGYFDQLTAERLIIERKAGMMVRRWDLQSHRANEALDVRVYAYAALQGLVFSRGLKLARLAEGLARAFEPAEPAEGQPKTGVTQPAVTPARPPAPLAGVAPHLQAARPFANQPRRSTFMQLRR